MATRGVKPALTAEKPYTGSDWTPPDHLSRQAKREYKRLVGLLNAHGKLAETDPTLVEMYAINHEMLLAASDSVKLMGTVITTDRGAILSNPACSVVNAASMRLKSIISELGLSPSTAKPNLNIEDEDSERWSDLIE